MPAGYYFLLIEDVTYGKIFIAIYGVLATYFSCVMIRLMLTLAPAVCIIAGITLSEVFRKAGDSIRESMLDFDEEFSEEVTSKRSEAEKENNEDKSAKEPVGGTPTKVQSKSDKKESKKQEDVAKEKKAAK